MTGSQEYSWEVYGNMLEDYSTIYFSYSMRFGFVDTGCLRADEVECR